jgi:hypothetical protein
MGIYHETSTSKYGGDNHKTATFLNLMLPWFVEVLVQDGAFFIHSFPNHPVSNLLKVRRRKFAMVRTPILVRVFVMTYVLSFATSAEQTNRLYPVGRTKPGKVCATRRRAQG